MKSVFTSIEPVVFMCYAVDNTGYATIDSLSLQKLKLYMLPDDGWRITENLRKIFDTIRGTVCSSSCLRRYDFVVRADDNRLNSSHNFLSCLRESCWSFRHRFCRKGCSRRSHILGLALKITSFTRKKIIERIVALGPLGSRRSLDNSPDNIFRW